MKKAFVLLAISLPRLSKAVANSASSRAILTFKVKTGIAKLGIGTVACIEIKLHDKTKLKGYVSQISEESLGVGATFLVLYLIYLAVGDD